MNTLPSLRNLPKNILHWSLFTGFMVFGNSQPVPYPRETSSFAQFSQDSGSTWVFIAVPSVFGALFILNFIKNKGILHTADEETPTRTPDFRSTACNTSSPNGASSDTNSVQTRYTQNNNDGQKKKVHHLNPEDLDMYPILPISEAIKVKEGYIPDIPIELQKEDLQLNSGEESDLTECTFCLEKIKMTDEVRRKELIDLSKDPEYVASMVKLAPDILVQHAENTNNPPKLISRTKNTLMFYIKNNSKLNVTFVSVTGRLSEYDDSSKVIEEVSFEELKIKKEVPPGEQLILNYRFNIYSEPSLYNVETSLKFTDENGVTWEKTPLDKTMEVFEYSQTKQAELQAENFRSAMHFDNSVLLDISNNEVFHARETATEQDVLNAVDWYINSLTTTFYNSDEPWLETDFIKTCACFFDSPLFKNYSSNVVSHVLDRFFCANASSVDCKEIWLEIVFLSLACNHSSAHYSELCDKNIFPALVNLILNSSDKSIVFSSILLCTNIIENNSVHLQDYQHYINDLAEFLLDYIEDTFDWHCEDYTQKSTLLLLSLNTFYIKNCKKLTLFADNLRLRDSSLNSASLLIPSKKKLKSKHLVLKSPLLQLLINRIGKFNAFAQNIVFILNRSYSDNSVIYHITRFISLVFRNSQLESEFFYKNDLNILVDIIIRELTNSLEVDLKYVLIKHKINEINYLLVQLLRKTLENNIDISIEMENAMNDHEHDFDHVNDLSFSRLSISDTVSHNDEPFSHKQRTFSDPNILPIKDTEYSMSYESSSSFCIPSSSLKENSHFLSSLHDDTGVLSRKNSSGSSVSYTNELGDYESSGSENSSSETRSSIFTEFDDSEKLLKREIELLSKKKIQSFLHSRRTARKHIQVCLQRCREIQALNSTGPKALTGKTR
ncbi:hypothetical protein BB560_000943 [Smittium megazygosporum]|uniref:SPIN90/Ldb17 leucine-rich domain-containing protein n=1 Tax=Smittium megazygosporum TaxID=133381 RepID=A0A2T9ZIW8_9FUNG|nr:hypothetical protein BB560_000943 [Smittium megazygosporum]